MCASKDVKGRDGMSATGVNALANVLAWGALAWMVVP